MHWTRFFDLQDTHARWEWQCALLCPMCWAIVYYFDPVHGDVPGLIRCKRCGWTVTMDGLMQELAQMP